MATYIIRRLLQTVIVIIAVTFIVFSILHMLPGDPARIMLGESATQAQIDALRLELMLDRPLLVQYGHWLGNVLRGDLGKSVYYQHTVSELIASRLPRTVQIGLIALILSAILGIIPGIISAVRRGSVLDQVINVTANLGMSIPNFWLAILFIYIFGLKLGWLPLQGYTLPSDDLLMNIKQITMPSIILATSSMASLTRQTRSSMLEVIYQDYIRTARSKGLREKMVITRHALRNAIIPVITLLGFQVRNVVGGSVLVETVFNIAGMGQLMVTSVLNKDFLVAQGVILVVALVVSLINLLVDLSYGYFDPKIRYER